MELPKATNRRTVLKTIGAGVVGGTVLTGSASGHPPKQNGQIPVFLTWGDHEVWEMIDAEPPSRDRLQDAEGNDHAHSPLYLIAPVPDSSHSPMFGFADQVVAVPGGPDANNFSAQWHPKVVLKKGESLTPANLALKNQDGKLLTSATRIKNATNVDIFAFPEETVFTCPVRPHHDRGPD